MAQFIQEMPAITNGLSKAKDFQDILVGTKFVSGQAGHWDRTWGWQQGQWYPQQLPTWCPCFTPDTRRRRASLQKPRATGGVSKTGTLGAGEELMGHAHWGSFPCLALPGKKESYRPHGVEVRAGSRYHDHKLHPLSLDVSWRPTTSICSKGGRLIC